MAEELLRHAQEADDAGPLIHHQHRAGADGGEVGALHALIGVLGIQLRGGGQPAGRAAQLHQLELMAVLDATGQVIDDLPQGDAEGDLEHAGVFDVAADRDELGARAVGSALALIEALLVQEQGRDQRGTPHCSHRWADGRRRTA